MNIYSNCIKSRLTARHRACIAFAAPSQRVLDIGCWIGWCEQLLGSSSTIGIDVDAKALALAKKSNPSCDFVCASALHLPFQNKTFQTVLMFDTLEHTPFGSEPLVFREANKVLDLNGKVVVSTYNMHPITVLADPAFLVGHRHYTMKQLISLLSEGGFISCKTNHGGGIIEAYGMILLYFFKYLFHREIPFKIWYEKQREKEFQGKGFMELFIRGTKNEP